MSISGILQVVSPDYVTFVVLIFINALGTSGVYPLAFILGKYIHFPKLRIDYCLVLFYVLLVLKCGIRKLFEILNRKYSKRNKQKIVLV